MNIYNKIKLIQYIVIFGLVLVSLFLTIMFVFVGFIVGTMISFFAGKAFNEEVKSFLKIKNV